MAITHHTKVGAVVAEYSAPVVHEYTSFATEIDLLNDANGPQNGNPARGFKVISPGAGTLEIRLVTGVLKTLTVTAGAENFEPIQFRAIGTNTNATRVRVYW